MWLHFYSVTLTKQGSEQEEMLLFMRTKQALSDCSVCQGGLYDDDLCFLVQPGTQNDHSGD